MLKDGLGNDDFYDAFFAAVGAPIWHGRNRDALNDSISTGGINEVEIPYRLEVVNGAKKLVKMRGGCSNWSKNS